MFVKPAVARTWPRRRNERALRIRSFTTRCLVRSPLVWLESRRVPRLERPNRSTRRRQTGRQRTDTFTQRRGRTASTRSRRRGPAAPAPRASGLGWQITFVLVGGGVEVRPRISFTAFR